MRRRLITCAVSALVMGALLTGCAEKKMCYFQTLYPGLKVDNTDCGEVHDVTLAKCEQMGRESGKQVRHAWGDLPPWCTSLGGTPVKAKP